MTVKLYIATTLDGYIATLDDDLQWLFDVEGDGDNGYSDFLKDIDTIIMGKSTYDWLLKAEPNNWPYQKQKSYIITHQKLTDTEDVQFVDQQLLENLPTDSKNIWVVGGGQIIKLFLEHHLVDEMQITIAPVLLGKGIPLFSQGNYAEQLKLVGTKTYGQFVELHYKVKK